MARRRALTGTPLLVASGLGLTVACGGSKTPEPVGNLMAPPPVHVELCVDAFPPSSLIKVDGTPLPGRCIELDSWEGATAHLEVTAEGLPPHVEDVVLTPPKQTLTVTLAPEPPTPPPPPIGNLMPPPPPVGNLVAPPRPPPTPKTP